MAPVFAHIIAALVRTLLIVLCVFTAAVGAHGGTDEAFKKRVDAMIGRSGVDGATLPKPEQGRNAEGTIAVIILGEIRRPGIYYLKQGSRVIDALEAAGGFAGGISYWGSFVRRRADDGTERRIRFGKNRYSNCSIVLSEGDMVYLTICVL